MKLQKNPMILALIAAVATTVLGYLINQLPEMPNKEQNWVWIILAVVLVTVVVFVVAVLQNQSSSGGRTVVRGNILKGKKNQMRVSQQDVEVRDNTIDGEEQSFSVENDPNSSGSSQGRTP